MTILRRSRHTLVEEQSLAELELRRLFWLRAVVGLAWSVVAGCSGGARTSGDLAMAPPPSAVVSSPYFDRELDQPVWPETNREILHVGGSELVLIERVSPSDGGSVTITRRDGTVLGGYSFEFGGLGGTLRIVARCFTPTWVLLALRSEGRTKPYHHPPGEAGCPLSEAPLDGATDAEVDAAMAAHGVACTVSSSTEVAFAEIAIDATHVWLVSGDSATEPVRACYVRR